MRAHELKEAFTSQIPMQIVRAGNDLFTTRAEINGRFITVNCVSYGDNKGRTIWEVDFSEKTPHGGVTFAKTGNGGELQVFSFAIASIKELISRYAPDEITFSSYKADGNRTQLYKRMLSKIRVPGYTHSVITDHSESSDYFSIVKESESYQPPSLEVGDKILKGKFKNSPAEIKGFKKDKHNQPVLKTNTGDVQLFKPRVVKLDNRK